MKKAIYLILVVLSTLSCKKDDDSDSIVPCNYSETPINISQSNAIIPLHTENFWVYSDSLFENGVFGEEKSTLIKVEKTYDYDGLPSMQFSSIIPQLTLRNDTLFSTSVTPSHSSPNCYELISPMFFQPTDSVKIDGATTDVYLYKSKDSIVTQVGVFSNNIIYNSADFYKIAVNEDVGIIRISFFISNVDGIRIKRRILTLKDYHLYK